MRKLLRHKKTALSLALFIFSAALYAGTLRHGFVSDDHFLIESSASLSASAPADIFLSGTRHDGETLFYRPLTMLSYALDHRLWGLRPAGYHLTSILLNSTVTVLLFLLTYMLFRHYFLKNEILVFSFISAVIFCAHPAHTEAAASIAGRGELLCSLFYLSAGLFYLRSLTKPAWYFLSLFFFLAGLFSRETALTLPLVIIVYDYIDGSFSRERFKYYIGYMLAFLVYISFRVFALSSALKNEPSWYLSDVTAGHRALTVLKTLGVYVKLAFFPFSLNPYYERFSSPGIMDANLAVLILAAAAVLYFIFKNRGIAVFLPLWFLITLIPSLNIIPIERFIRERSLYLPSMSAAWLAAFVLARGVFSLDRRIRASAFAAALILVTAFSAKAILQNETWKNDISFWKAVVKADPGSFTANYTLGKLSRNDNRNIEAENYLWKAVSIKPDSIQSYFELGLLYKTVKDDERAAEMFSKTIELAAYNDLKLPDERNTRLKASVFNHLGEIAYRNGRYGLAEQYYMSSIQNNSSDPVVFFNTGALYIRMDKYALAQVYTQKALDFNPAYKEALTQMGAALSAQGNNNDAVSFYEKALNLDKYYFPAAYSLALTVEKTDPAGSIDLWIRALKALEKIEPQSPLLVKIRLHISKLGVGINAN